METLGSALGYLLWRGFRNRWAAQLRNARTPRYIIATVLGAVYLWFFLFRRTQFFAPPGGVLPTSFVPTMGGMYATVYFMWIFGSAWLSDQDQNALAFTPAEVTLLFTAPVTRRELLIYRLVRLQLRVLLNVVIWVFLLRRTGSVLPAPLRAVGVWAVFTTASLHRVGAALVKSSWAEHGREGRRRTWVATAVLGLVVVAVAVSLVDGLPMLKGTPPPQWPSAFVGLMATGPARIALWPIHAVSAPMLSQTAAGWLQALPAALLVVLVHVVWVMRTDTAFEEAAAAASAARVARIRAMRAGRSPLEPASALSAAQGGGPLSPTGHPVGAIIWKNIICLRRRVRLKSLWLVMAMPVLWASVVIPAGGAPGDALMVLGLGAAAVLTVFGPILLRNDLRQDMLNIVVLKVLPMSGRTIVTAEVLSTVVPIAIAQFVMIVVAGIGALTAADLGLPSAELAAIMVGALPVLLMFDATLVTIQNTAPVLFPSWTRLGPTPPARTEFLGQMILVIGVVVLALGMTLLVPGGLAAAIIYFGRSRLPLSTMAGMLAGASVLGAEVYALIGMLGGVLLKTEPAEVA